MAGTWHSSPPTPTAQRQLWVRALDSPRTQPLAGTEGASDPFWSPAGDEIAFFANNQLKRVPAAGGAPAVITDAGIGAGGSWSAAAPSCFSRISKAT